MAPGKFRVEQDLVCTYVILCYTYVNLMLSGEYLKIFPISAMYTWWRINRIIKIDYRVLVKLVYTVFKYSIYTCSLAWNHEVKVSCTTLLIHYYNSIRYTWTNRQAKEVNSFNLYCRDAKYWGKKGCQN